MFSQNNITWYTSPFGELHNLPEFGELQRIWVTNEEVEMDTIQRIYLSLKMYETVRFDEHDMLFVSL